MENGIDPIETHMFTCDFYLYKTRSRCIQIHALVNLHKIFPVMVYGRTIEGFFLPFRFLVEICCFSSFVFTRPYLSTPLYATIQKNNIHKTKTKKEKKLNKRKRVIAIAINSNCIFSFHYELFTIFLLFSIRKFRVRCQCLRDFLICFRD